MKTGENSKENQGFTLLELIVVIAVLAIISGIAISGTGMIGTWKMKECVKQLDAAISETQLNAMSKGQCALVISKDAENQYWLEMTNQNKTKIADERVEIYYVDSQSITEHLLTEELIITFDAASGALLPIAQANNTDIYCKKLIIRLGDKRETTIIFSQETGRHTMQTSTI